MVRQVSNATSPLPLVTSVFSYCGLDVADNGTIISEFADTCAGLFPALAALGVRNEIALNAGNCSIDAYRLLWSDTQTSPQQILAAAQAANASGVNIDLEPQADNCRGSPTGTAADAVQFAKWLTAVRTLLNGAGIRLTVDVAAWSPVLSQSAVLAPSVDRLLTMQTYNGDSYADWEATYSAFVSAIPRDVAGIGIGVWNVTGATQWWETPAAATAKIDRIITDGIVEVAAFRFLPPQWPLPFWWGPFSKYMSAP